MQNLDVILNFVSLLNSVGVKDRYDQATVIKSITENPQMYGLQAMSMDEPGTHDGRVAMGLKDETILHELRNGKKISAIKQMRAIAQCSLKEAKDAVEDYRLMACYVQPF